MTGSKLKYITASAMILMAILLCGVYAQFRGGWGGRDFQMETLTPEEARENELMEKAIDPGFKRTCSPSRGCGLTMTPVSGSAATACGKMTRRRPSERHFPPLRNHQPQSPARPAFY